MDPGGLLHYHKHFFDSTSHLENYFSGNPDMVFTDDSLIFPLKKLHLVFSLGFIHGDSMVDISFSSFVHHLFSACDFFKEITLLRVSDRCILELNKWLNTRTGAFDWTHTSHILSEITEKSDQNFYQDIKLKEAIKRILRCDLDEENLTDSEILAPAECVISVLFLDVTSEDENCYKRNLKKIVKLLKPGGHLILFGVKHGTYFIVGEEKFHMFKYDETFVRKALIDEGLIIDDCEVQDSKVETDLTDYEGVIFILSHKDK